MLVCDTTDLLPQSFHDRFEMGSDSQLMLLFQPTVSLPDTFTTGAEALVRWVPNCGSGEPVPNADWIPAAEEEGYMPAVDDAISEVVLQCAASLQERIPGFTTALNVSASSLCSGLAPLLIERSAGLDRSLVDVEVTETSNPTADSFFAESLNELTEAGFAVLLDDFGTGYGTLSHLTSLNIAGVKLDRSFVGNIESDPQCAAVVSSVRTLTDMLGLRAVAEGVETVGQATRLEHEGYTEAQGWLFGRPMTMSQLLHSRETQLVRYAAEPS